MNSGILKEFSRFQNARVGDLLAAFRSEIIYKTNRSVDLHGYIAQAIETLDEIKDIRDELNIIDSLVQEQNAVWSQLSHQSCGSSTQNETPKKGSHRGSSTDPDFALKQVKDLIQRAEASEHNVCCYRGIREFKEMLTLFQITSFIELHLGLGINQLNLSEAQESRMQGKILMVFTVVTVIFVSFFMRFPDKNINLLILLQLPLSFLSSLFALNVSTFPHSGNEVQYQPGWIFGIMCKSHKFTEERYLTQDTVGATVAFILLLLPFTVLREAIFGRDSFSRALFGTIKAETITKLQELLRKVSPSAGPHQGERRLTAERDGHGFV